MNLCHRGRLGKGWKYSTEGEEGRRWIALWKKWKKNCLDFFCILQNVLITNRNTKTNNSELFSYRKRSLVPERKGPSKSFFSSQKNDKRKTEFDLLRSNRYAAHHYMLAFKNPINNNGGEKSKDRDHYSMVGSFALSNQLFERRKISG